MRSAGSRIFSLGVLGGDGTGGYGGGGLNSSEGMLKTN